MFRAPLCSSSGESFVLIWHLVYVTVCRWLSSVQVWMELQFHPNLHTRRSPTESDIYQMSYWYKWFSWRWAQGCSKHVENWNKYIRKIESCIRLVVFKNWTEMHGQQNIKFKLNVCHIFVCLIIHIFYLKKRCHIFLCNWYLRIYPTWFVRRKLTLRRLMSYIYGAPILDVSRSHTTTQHSR